MNLVKVKTQVNPTSKQAFFYFSFCRRTHQTDRDKNPLSSISSQFNQEGNYRYSVQIINNISKGVQLEIPLTTTSKYFTEGRVLYCEIRNSDET